MELDGTDGITELRLRRGSQQVTFSEVADHLFDYVERFPSDEATLARVASFLVAVEGLPHDHDADPLRGLSQPAMRPGHAPSQVR